MAKVKKIKKKTHKGVKKALNIKQSGVITKQNVGNNHKTGKKSPARKIKSRSKSELDKSDLKRLKNVI